VSRDIAFMEVVFFQGRQTQRSLRPLGAAFLSEVGWQSENQIG
jgi:hypothetical protein